MKSLQTFHSICPIQYMIQYYVRVVRSFINQSPTIRLGLILRFTVFVNYNEFSLIFTNKFFLQNLHSVMYGVIYVRLFDYLTTNLNNLQRLGFCDLNMLLPNFRNDYQSLFAVKSGSMSSTCFVFLFIPAEKLFIFLKLKAHIQHS